METSVTLSYSSQMYKVVIIQTSVNRLTLVVDKISGMDDKVSFINASANEIRWMRGKLLLVLDVCI